MTASALCASGLKEIEDKSRNHVRSLSKHMLDKNPSEAENTRTCGLIQASNDYRM